MTKKRAPRGVKYGKITVKLPLELRKRLVHYCNQSDVTITSVVTRLLSDWINGIRS